MKNKKLLARGLCVLFACAGIALVVWGWVINDEYNYTAMALVIVGSILFVASCIVLSDLF